MNSKFLKSIAKAGINNYNELLHKIPFSSYNHISAQSKKEFKDVMDVWMPEHGPKTQVVRWNITQWCNYNCPYCPQDHGRFAKYGTYTAHAFDNYPLDQWIQAFKRHFSEKHLSLVITGGEPLLDVVNMRVFLKELTAMPTVECIRLDTNASWKPEKYVDLDLSKIILMCTFHPSQVSTEAFFDHIERLKEVGFNIGMVNFVMDHSNIKLYKDIKVRMNKAEIPLHPNPLWDAQGMYSEEDLQILREELPEVDFLHRTRKNSTFAKKCLFPALAYQMTFDGNIHIGCHGNFSGSFFDEKLPELFAGPVPCPAKSCICLDMYSFLKDINRNTDTNPLKVYSELLKDIRGIEATTV